MNAVHLSFGLFIRISIEKRKTTMKDKETVSSVDAVNDEEVAQLMSDQALRGCTLFRSIINKMIR